MKSPFKKSRLIARLWLVFFASLNRYCLRYFPLEANKILIPTQLLLGDCILMLSLIDKAVLNFPLHEIVVAAPAYAIDIFKKLNLPITLISWQEKNIADLQSIRSHGPFEVAYIPFEKWSSVWANAFGAKNVVGFTFPDVKFHDRFLTQTVRLPNKILPVSDWLMALIEGANPTSYKANSQLFFALKQDDATKVSPLKQGQPKKVILHIGARNENRRWTAQNWNILAKKIRANNMQVMWTYAANEKDWSEQMDKKAQDWDSEGDMSFDALLSLIAQVDAVVSPDTGVAHLCKLTATPSVVIYGQGNPSIHGNGEYWKLSPACNIFLENIPCRSMTKVFGRNINGVKRCDLSPTKCANPFCQNDINAETVMNALQALLA